MEEKKLPIVYPGITSYPLYAALFSILSQNESSLKWLYLNYMQIIAYDTGNGHVWMDYYSKLSDGMCFPRFEACPFLNAYRIPRELIKMKWETAESFLIDAIDQGYYCYFFIDRKHIDKYNAWYKDNDPVIYKHECLIYGYDKKERTFDYADFFEGTKYTFTNVPMSEVENAYRAFQDDIEYDRFQGVYLLKHRASDTICYDSEITCMLLEYLGKRNIYHFLGARTGVKAHDKLSQYLLYCGTNNICPDIRMFHMLSDHKTIMLSVAHIVTQITGYKSEECIAMAERNQRSAVGIRNKLLVCKTSEDFKPLIKLAEKIDELKKIEEQYIQDLITGLCIRTGNDESSYIG